MISQSSATIAIDSQFLSFVPASVTTNDYLSDILMKNLTCDQFDLKIAATDRSFQLITEFYHYRFTCLKLSKREFEGNSNYVIPIVE